MHRVLRGKNVIIQRSLVIIGIASGRLVTEKRLGQPEHIICITGFRTFARLEYGREIRRIVEMFALAVSAKRHAAMIDDGIPKKTRRVTPRSVAAQSPPG